VEFTGRKISGARGILQQAAKLAESKRVEKV
jgi:hypothetical protein